MLNRCNGDAILVHLEYFPSGAATLSFLHWRISQQMQELEQCLVLHLPNDSIDVARSDPSLKNPFQRFGSLSNFRILMLLLLQEVLDPDVVRFRNDELKGGFLKHYSVKVTAPAPMPISKLAGTWHTQLLIKREEPFKIGR